MSRIGEFDKVTISTDGPDVILQMPGNPVRAHWTDFVQIEEGILLAVKQARDWETANAKNGGRTN